MKKIGTLYALTALAAAGIHFEPGDVIRGEGIDDEEKAKLLRQRQATEDKADVADVIAARKERDAARAKAEAEEEAERQAEIEETIRPAVEKIVGELLAAQKAKG
jgi:hypothetical protein